MSRAYPFDSPDLARRLNEHTGTGYDRLADEHAAELEDQTSPGDESTTCPACKRPASIADPWDCACWFEGAQWHPGCRDRELARRENFTNSHKEGAAALTTVEARGTTSRYPWRAVSASGRETGRAAGAQLTGQRQDGPSQGPACAQDPATAHGGRGASSSPSVNGDDQAPKDGLPRADQEADNLAASSPGPSCADALQGRAA